MLTEYERGKRDIAEWLEYSDKKHIAWKIQVCLDNCPSDSRYQPYYKAMLEELHKAQESKQHPLTIVASRIHQNDIGAGELLVDGTWEHLNLPIEELL